MDSRAVESVGSLCGVNLTQAEISCPEAQDFISSLPNEIFRAILDKVQTLEMIPLRVVSNRWKVVIESICLDKKCLVMMHPNPYHLSEFLRRYNLSKMSKVSVVNLKTGLFAHLPKLFPRIEQFCLLNDIRNSSTEFNSMLQQWSPSLTSLYIRLYRSEEVNNICAQINKLTNLKQLNVDSLSDAAQHLRPTLARLEHLSGWIWGTIKEITPYLGENFSSLGSIRQPASVIMDDITKWHRLNAKSVSNLLRICLSVYDLKIFPYICKHFSSLQMLSINICNLQLTAMIRQLAQLTHLAEFFTDYNLIDLASLDDSSLRPLRNIRILSLLDFKFVRVHGEKVHDVLHLNDLPENIGFRFIRFLSIIFPNVEKLTIKGIKPSYDQFVDYSQIGNLFEPHVNLFGNLRWHDFGLNEPTI